MDCGSPPPAALLRGIAEFNDGEYFACHETLEALWRAERGPVRRLYQGVLQVAVALHHLERGNLPGARSILAKAEKHLAACPAPCLGVDVAALREDTRLLAESLAGSDAPADVSMRVRTV